MLSTSSRFTSMRGASESTLKRSCSGLRLAWSTISASLRVWRLLQTDGSLSRCETTRVGTRSPIVPLSWHWASASWTDYGLLIGTVAILGLLWKRSSIRLARWTKRRKWWRRRLPSQRLPKTGASSRSLSLPLLPACRIRPEVSFRRSGDGRGLGPGRFLGRRNIFCWKVGSIRTSTGSRMRCALQGPIRTVGRQSLRLSPSG